MRNESTGRVIPSFRHNMVDYSLILIGAFLQALSYVVFLAPYKIVPGGVYGISIVLHYVSKGVFSFFPDGLPMGFFTDLLSYFITEPLVENDAFIAAFYGGAILGMGVTCVFKAQSTSAGTDVLARVIAKNSNLKVSNMIIVLDSAIVLLGLVAFQDWAVPLYSWFTIFVYGKIVEMFQSENPSRAVFIVSQNTAALKEVIVNKLGMRGTFIHGKGMYEGHETEIIFTIAERKDLPKLKDEIREIDPHAFVSSMHASKDSPRPGI